MDIIITLYIWRILVNISWYSIDEVAIRTVVFFLVTYGHLRISIMTYLHFYQN